LKELVEQIACLQNKLREITEMWAWLAGTVDSEGTLTFKNRTPALIMSAKDESMMERASILIGKQMVPTEIERYPGTIYWLIQAYKEVPAVLEKITPYLTAKKRQADLILRFIDETDDKVKDEIIALVHLLNKKSEPDERYKGRTPYAIKESD